MATLRFEKLSNEKKIRIINAAREEFARMSFDKVSINRIVKNAKISRGSFYTYFKDKEDLLQCVFEADNKQCMEIFQESIIANNGDLWKAISTWIEQIAAYLKKGAFQQTLRIMTKNDIIKRAADWVKSTDNFVSWMDEHIDKIHLNYSEDKEQLRLLIKTAHTIAGIGLLNILAYPENDERIYLNEINRQLEILRYGAEAHVRL